MSQCSRVLEVLRDHKPHSITEIHERAGTMRLNSRISDLRNMGFNIAYFRKDGLHTYQLLPELGAVRTPQESGAKWVASDGTSAALGLSPSLDSPASPLPETAPGDPPSPSETPAQLSLEAA